MKRKVTIGGEREYHGYKKIDWWKQVSYANNDGQIAPSRATNSLGFSCLEMICLIMAAALQTQRNCNAIWYLVVLCEIIVHEKKSKEGGIVRNVWCKIMCREERHARGLIVMMRPHLRQPGNWFAVVALLYWQQHT